MKNKKYCVKVPATSANFGSGFDTIGAAFSLYNIFEFEILQNKELVITGCDPEFCNEDNLIYQSMKVVFNKANITPPGVHIHEVNNIPIGKGLGSSATCIVGGLIGANLICGQPFTLEELFEMAIEIEGHPDNVTPAFFGGLTTALICPGKPTFYNSLPISDKFSFFACIPNFTLSTEEARRLLPDSYSRSDVVFNISHALMTFIALVKGEVKVIPEAIDDKIHEPYRKVIIDGYSDIESGIQECGGLTCFISGAGPTIMCIAESSNLTFESQMNSYVNKNLTGWKFVKLEPDNTGAVFLENTLADD